ncbi:metallophosphoesterase family protein [Alkalibacter mobilis]|uniref:metallophosphoesterase family protein n=1 Tax=Alkalibacter mobilis TaxID=2787712 RepID=UPI00189EE013|nr:DNA repair exonuclease [Alkalibacter mobilis]MBF7096601.1 DNA repair exonuclease [Alkalibacter mobilis]
MNRFKFIHISDVHIGTGFEKSSLPSPIRKELKMDIWKSFRSIIEECLSKKIDFLFISGDLFEHDKVRMSDLKTLESYFKTIENTRVYIAPGNHDPMNGDMTYDMLEWPSNVKIFSKQIFEEVSINEWLSIWGFGWENNSVSGMDLGKEPQLDPLKTNILLAHGDVLDSESDYLPMKEHFYLLDQFDYVAMGHIHKPTTTGEKVSYSGAPIAMSFKDKGSRGYIKGDVEKGRIMVEFTSLDYRKFVELDFEFDPRDDFTEICRKLKILSTNWSGHLVKIDLKGIIGRDIEIDQIKELAEEYFYHVEFIDNYILDYDLEVIYNENKDNIIGKFIKEMAKENLENNINRHALYYGLEALLQERQQ